MKSFLQQPRQDENNETRRGPSRWSMGILNDPKTVEVPGWQPKQYPWNLPLFLLITLRLLGSVLLLAAHKNQPLGLRNVRARTSHSSIPAGFPVDAPQSPGSTHRPAAESLPGGASAESDDKKKTEDGTIILEPQPEDSANDPLNWPSWRRDLALLSLGLYCMIGGGITPLIAAGFTDVAHEFHMHTEGVALTTGLYMMGLGVGSVLMSPTAILFGKRPVYLASALIFIATSLWAGWSPSFNSLLIARVFQGIAVSPVECLPSATIAEIFYLHERAFRIGIYTLLLLGGKNLVPLVSAAIIGRWGWRWVFWITAMVVGLGFFLLFFFVPETFWDRTPSRKPSKRPSFLRRLSSRYDGHTPRTPRTPMPPSTSAPHPEEPTTATHFSPRTKNLHVGFLPESDQVKQAQQSSAEETPQETAPNPYAKEADIAEPQAVLQPGNVSPLRYSQSPQPSAATRTSGLFSQSGDASSISNIDSSLQGRDLEAEKISASDLRGPPKIHAYTHNLRQKPAQSFAQQLRPYHGRLNGDKWIKVMIRPFILFAYPAVLWSAAIYACSIGWLIVISETMAIIYRDPTRYNFTALQTGLVYVSPFVGGVLGTGVAGKISDIIVKIMAARNGGLYEPEFRLIMAAPILVTTCIGLMGFGWSVEERDHWIVPTLLFGVMSFGCSLGSTTSITFCVDSYRQYAGEALVTLNFAKNIFHGLVFSLFVTHWMADDGPKSVFIWIGIIQLIIVLSSVPMYIFGKRARMWTARKNLMENF